MARVQAAEIALCDQVQAAYLTRLALPEQLNKSPMKKDVRTDKPHAANSRKRPVTAGVDRELQAKIGSQLRAMHDDIIKEGVPERFQELLARLDGTDTKDR